MSQQRAVGVPRRYIEFFLDSSPSVARIECLEIRHSGFSQVYRVVRNATRGITVRHEDGLEYAYEYYPLRLENLGARDDLDAGLSVNLGEQGGIVGKEVARVMAGDAILEKPRLVYRAYRSDDLEKIMYGPLELEITTISYNKEGASFEARAPSLNVHRTGEVYRMDRFPSLRGFL